MAAGREPTAPRGVIGAIGVAALVVLLWAFPLLRIVPLKAPPRGGGGSTGGASFDATAVAARIWAGDLPVAAGRAAELKIFASQLRSDPRGTKAARAKAAGLGTAYYFIRGSGTVVARDGSYVRLALDGAESTLVALRIGPVFGNAVRDGCGLLDLNAFPGLQEFNALAAELNALVEKHVLPVLRAKATVGAQVRFAGCAEAPEAIGGPEEPLLIVVPVQAEVR